MPAVDTIPKGTKTAGDARPSGVDLSGSILRRVSLSLRAEHAVLYALREDALEPAHSIGITPPACAINTTAGCLEGMQPGSPALHWSALRMKIAASGRRLLDLARPELLIPVFLRNRLEGLLLLGPKRFGEPYSKTDLRLLENVASQLAVALETRRLNAVLASESARKRDLEWELAVAREVQEGLFPRQLPEIPGLEYSAMWRPARDVGGDYYDFLALPGGRLSVVIGDIAGKGVAAALLMAGLQALVRGQTILSTEDLGALTSAINRIFYQASPANCYATLFYGCYDPSTRRLDFVNAGHEPPFVLRGGRAIGLEPGGSVVGLFPDPGYEPASVTLEPGDVMFAFTDGITEMMDSSKSEWGRERLLAVARECCNLKAQDAVARIVGAADEFAAGARQHDDMTLLVLRVLS